MFFARLIALLFLVAYSFSLGSQSNPNTFGTVVGLSFFLWVPVLYLLPTYEAWRLKHVNLMSISLINILMGWTLLGWVVAVVWAFKRPEAQAA